MTRRLTAKECFETMLAMRQIEHVKLITPEPETKPETILIKVLDFNDKVKKHVPSVK